VKYPSACFELFLWHIAGSGDTSLYLYKYCRSEFGVISGRVLWEIASPRCVILASANRQMIEARVHRTSRVDVFMFLLKLSSLSPFKFLAEKYS
jgi:hypothetical protein